MPRPKGVPNKLTQGARHAIFEVFDLIGGVGAFAEWASENKQEYYKLWGKTIPQHLQHSGVDGEPIAVLSLTDAEMLEQWKNQQKDSK